MESMIERIEKAYREKVSLLQALLECLNRERENLIHVDVNGLWALMGEKQRILSSIQETEQVIAACAAESPDHSPRRHATAKLGREIRRLKMEIRARVRENVSFIDETLQFFDEIMSIFASGKRPEYGYEPPFRRQTTPCNLIFESEV